jgi:hypothetical protein
MKLIESRGKQMPIIGQPTAMECWITCYQMLLNSSGIPWNLAKIEERLVAGGFAAAKQSRASGIGDEELLQCARALGLGSKKTSELSSVAAAKSMMVMHGPLWIAGHFQGSDNSRYKHVVMAIGAEEELNTIAIVNPWQESPGDTPTIGWMRWADFKKAITPTANVEGSVQYLNPLAAANMRASSNFVVHTATFHRVGMNVFTGKCR